MRVSIIGMGKGWELAPEDGESWGITQTIMRRPVSLVIDMNVYDDGRWGQEQQTNWFITRELCKSTGTPLIGLHNYPYEDVSRHFDTDYFTNTVDYAIALALFRGYDELDLYGVNMEIGSEYEWEKPGVDFWCGVAIGMGRKVTVYGIKSRIMKSRSGLVYGYDMPQRWMVNDKEETGFSCHFITNYPEPKLT